jgi:hypothetical protein
MFAVPRLCICGLIAMALMVASGCGERQALDRYIVIGVADSLQRREGINWGAPQDVLPPEGRSSWWQVSYGSGPDGESRLILVDNETAWARFPPPNYRPRVPAESRPVQGQEVAVQPGPWVLVVTGTQSYQEGARPDLEAEVRQLNELAEHTGLYPSFSLREERGGGVQIVYGWQKNHGIARDEKVRDWLHLRTRFDHSLWIRLTE